MNAEQLILMQQAATHLAADYERVRREIVGLMKDGDSTGLLVEIEKRKQDVEAASDAMVTMWRNSVGNVE